MDPNNENKDDAGKDEGEAVFTQKQMDDATAAADVKFSGLLRDRQQDRVSLQETRQQVNDLQAEIKDSAKPKEEPMTKEDGETLVNKQMLDEFGKTIASGIAQQLDTRDAQNQQTTTSTSQRNDAAVLLKNKTVTAEGEGLDAGTVYNETVAWLQVNDPAFLEFAKLQPDYASRIDQYGRSTVPSIVVKAETRKNAKLAKQLDDGGNPQIGKVAGGGNLSPEQENLQSMLMGNVSTSDIDEMMSVAES